MPCGLFLTAFFLCVRIGILAGLLGKSILAARLSESRRSWTTSTSSWSASPSRCVWRRCNSAWEKCRRNVWIWCVYFTSIEKTEYLYYYSILPYMWTINQEGLSAVRMYVCGRNMYRHIPSSKISFVGHYQHVSCIFPAAITFPNWHLFCFFCLFDCLVQGNITRQEAVSMIPPLLLDVQPHHKVLYSFVLWFHLCVLALHEIHSQEFLLLLRHRRSDWLSQRCIIYTDLRYVVAWATDDKLYDCIQFMHMAMWAGVHAVCVRVCWHGCILLFRCLTCALHLAPRQLNSLKWCIPRMAPPQVSPLICFAPPSFL